MNKDQLQAAHNELNGSHSLLIAEHNTLIADHNALLEEIAKDNPDYSRAVESATKQMAGECAAQIKEATETNATLVAENWKIKEDAQHAMSKRKGIKIVAIGPDPFAGSRIEKGDVVATVTLAKGLTFNAVAEAGYFGRAGVERPVEGGGDS